MGRRIRAVVQNRDLAETSGISSRKTDITTFFIGSGLAAVAGVALTLIGSTSPTIGQSYLIDAFLVVVVGGLGQIKGTVIAAFCAGLPELVHRVQHHRVAGQGDRVRDHRDLPAGPPAGPVHRSHKEFGVRTLLGRWQTWAGFGVAAVVLFGVAPLVLSEFRLSPARKVPVLRDRRGRHRPGLGPGRNAGARPGRVLRPRRLHDGHAPQDRRRPDPRRRCARLHADRRGA